MLKINRFVNYLLLNRYGNVFQYEVKCFEIISFKDKLKMNKYLEVFPRKENDLKFCFQKLER